METKNAIVEDLATAALAEIPAAAAAELAAKKKHEKGKKIHKKAEAPTPGDLDAKMTPTEAPKETPVEKMEEHPADCDCADCQHKRKEETKKEGAHKPECTCGFCARIKANKAKKTEPATELPKAEPPKPEEVKKESTYLARDGEFKPEVRSGLTEQPLRKEGGFQRQGGDDYMRRAGAFSPARK